MRSLVVFVGERYYEAYVRDNRQARREEEEKRRMIQPSLRFVWNSASSKSSLSAREGRHSIIHASSSRAATAHSLLASLASTVPGPVFSSSLSLLPHVSTCTSIFFGQKSHHVKDDGQTKIVCPSSTSLILAARCDRLFAFVVSFA